jgi:outer membrane protein OmpA-like peptidoglycan-associated protein
MQRSKLPYFFLGLAAVLTLSAIIILVQQLLVKPAPSPLTGTISKEPQPSVETRKPEPIPARPDPGTRPKDPEATLKNPGPGLAATDSAELANRIAKAMETGDIAAIAKLLGKNVLDAETTERLKALLASHPKIRGIREVGELELNQKTRWALELEGAEPGRDRIFLDFKRDGQKWSIDKIILPPAPGEPIPKAMLADSLGVADAFLQAVLKQDFEFARAFVDPSTVSDAKIAGLCILFEEGDYRMRKSKPLRAMFQRQDTVGYLANIETADGKQTAQFSLNLRQPSAPANWRVSEINLDQLIADYARRFTGGDVYYSPIVKNPSGGDTLALYFEFNEDDINPRTRRQLEIVSLILRSDPGKKITLSGHTDSLGSDDYNRKLSLRRADVVRDFLAKAGVSPSQIVTLAKGASQPRRPNVTESGQDNPEGRRANRRTEIYLDF